MDVEKILGSGDERKLLDVWDVPPERRMWQRAIDVARAAGNEEHLRAAEEALAKLPEVAALDALRANAALVDLLTGRRWFVMQDAKESGASWEQIGEALGMSRQAAWEWYRRKIELQERHVPDFHDAERARAALRDTGRAPAGGEVPTE